MEERGQQTAQQTAQGWASQFGNMVSGQYQEKAYTDKLLGRKDVERLAQLMKKETLERSDVLELLYMLSAVEIKLSNLGDWDRYLLGKFYAWIRDFVNVAEVLYDWEDKVKKGDLGPELKNDEEVTQMMDNIQVLWVHNIKFLVDIFLYLSRSTLSLGMSAFDALSKMRYEYDYSQGYNGAPPAQNRSPLSFSVKA